ncbi:MAG: chemotaxis protein CheW [Chlorobi bacterium]|nr:chemotaxis protein CheW [Chlorobiota bacterium]
MDQSTNSYLTFKVNDNIFGIHVEKVVEIKEYKEPKSIPETLPYVTGVFEYRDEVIPLIDTAVKFNLGKINLTSQTCIVVLEIINEQKNINAKVGIIVDTVSDVIEADPEVLKQIEDDYKPNYISATYKQGDNLVMIINANKIFSAKDIIAMDKAIDEINTKG